jgi:hypothetical protein
MLMLGACKCGAGTDAQEYTLCYPSWQVLMYFDVCSSVCDKISHVWQLWMQVTHGLQVQANEDAIIVAVEWAV